MFLDDQILSVLAVAAVLAAFFTVSGTVFLIAAEIGKVVESLVHDKYDVAASAAVTAVRSACRNVKFAAEAYMTVAAAARANDNINLICKHPCNSFAVCMKNKRPQ